MIDTNITLEEEKSGQENVKKDEESSMKNVKEESVETIEEEKELESTPLQGTIEEKLGVDKPLTELTNDELKKICKKKKIKFNVKDTKPMLISKITEGVNH